MRSTSRIFGWLILPMTLSCATLHGARAQMVLPGAVAPTPEGTTVSPSVDGTGRAKARGHASGGLPAAPTAARTPGLAALAGQTLFLNGGKSQLTFQARDKSVAVAHLLLAGTRPSDSRADCQVEVPGVPIATTDLGKPNGLTRIQLDLPVCPIAFDILEGAALAVGDPATCAFKEQNCQVSPGGLWGPQPGALGPDKVKAIDHDRALAEAAVRSDFKLLLSTTKDRSTIMGYAREQAGFSSSREEICRDYAGEGRHGFCAARVTEARAAALRAKYDVEAAHKPPRKKGHAQR